MKVALTAITKRLVGPNDSAEYHCEMAARNCYDSSSKAKEETSNLVKSCTVAGHLSINGHASATFEIEEVSRALMAQATRSRTAIFSVRSQRYVKEDGFTFDTPEAINETAERQRIYMNTIMSIKKAYNDLLDLGVKAEDCRSLLPNACHTKMVMSSSFEGWLHFLRIRMDKHAQKEIRELAFEIYRQLNKQAPKIFNEITIMAPRKLSIDWDKV